MNTQRQTLLCLCLVAGCLLAVGLPATAQADPYDFHYFQGPAEAAMPVNDFFGFHSHMTNTGDNADTYTLTLDIDTPAMWSVSVCVNEICYPPGTTEVTVPSMGTLAPGETVDFIYDVTTLMDEGQGSFTVTVTSDTDGSVQGSWTYEVSTVTEGLAMLLSPGEGVLHGGVNEFISFHPLLFNAGTTADSYTLTMTRVDQPANWSTSFCVNEVCYPPSTTTVRIPEMDPLTVASGERVELAIDFTTLMDEGTGTVYIEVVSNTDPSLRSYATYTVTTGDVVGADDVPGFVLSDVQAAPNPFNPRTDIRFIVGGTESRDVLVDIYDATGRRVRTLLAGDMAPGAQSVTWDGCGDDGRILAAGVYLANVRTGAESQTVKMSLVK